MMRTAAVLVIVLSLVCTAGCFLLDKREVVPPPTAFVTPVPTPDSGMSVLDPADMALQLTDLPGGYIIRERSDIAYADISPLAREQGWKKGYLVSFYRMNVNQYAITAITQRISVYQVENIHLLDKRMEPVFENVKSDLLAVANASVSVTEMPFPKTGDRTAALRTIDSNDPFGIVTYTVIFTKKDVIEQVGMRGTTTDYEVLKEIVVKASEKIR